MKTEVSGSDFGININLIPETVEEMKILQDYALNAKMEKPSVYFALREIPYLNLWLKKINSSVQIHSLAPKKQV